VNLFTICISKGYVYLDYGRNVKNVMNNASKDIVYRIILIIYIYIYIYETLYEYDGCSIC